MITFIWSTMARVAYIKVFINFPGALTPATQPGTPLLAYRMAANAYAPMNTHTPRAHLKIVTQHVQAMGIKLVAAIGS